MPSLTIGRMAKLYRMHRSSLYQAVAEGRVSAGVDGKGQRVIDLAEMIRVYGEPPGLPDTCPTVSGSPPGSSVGPPDSAPMVTAGDQVQALLEAVERLTAEVEGLRAELAEHRLMLTHQPAEARQESTAANVSPPPVQPLSKRKAESFADLLAGLE